MEHYHHNQYKEVVADAGYERLDNDLYMDSTGQICFIKSANYDQSRSSKFKKQLGHIENMEYDVEEDCITCAQGRQLSLRREHSKFRNGQMVSTAWYRCDSCDGCPCRSQCCQAKDQAKPKELMLKKVLGDMRVMGAKNITTSRGIHLRLCRSS